MKKKSEFEAPYIGIETIDNTPIFYNRRGDYSVIIKCENPIIQYSADLDAYYDFHHLFTNILKVLGTGYTKYKTDKAVYKGLAELVKAEIIARGPADNLWFINPLIVFNGDRVTFAKTYVRKKTLAAQKKEEAEKRQLSLGFDEQ